MTEAAKEARREYKKAWNRAHPDRVRQHQETYWTKRAARDQAADPARGSEPRSAGGAE